MQKIISNIKNALSHKWATITILIIAVLSRALHLVFFFNIRVDRSYQLLATQNFVHGNGISLATVQPENLSEIIYTPLIKWPPGYSILLSPFYSLTGNNYLLSSLFLDLLFGVILIFVTRAILKLLDIPLYLVNIFTLITSFFIYYFYFITSSDAIATTFFLLAIYYYLRLLKLKKNELGASILITLFLFISAAIKYLFMPVIFVPPLLLAIKGWADKNKLQLKTGLLSIFFLAVSLAALLLYQKSISGASAYISESERGFFPANVLSAYPLIPGALIKTDTIALLLNNPAADTSILIAFRWIYFFFLVSALFFFTRMLYEHGFRKNNLEKDFFWIVTGVCAATSVLLAFLSLRVANAEYMPGIWWTFIQEPRYYGLPNVLIHISLFVFFQHFIIKKRSYFIKYIFYFLCLLLFIEVFRGIVFTAKRIKNLGKEEYSWQRDLKFQKYAAKLIQQEQLKYPAVEKIIVAGSSYFFNNRISLYNNIPILQQSGADISDSLWSTKKPVLVLIVMDNRKSALFLPVDKIKLNAVGQYAGFSFYVKYQLPD